jgi:hypothetical protein
MICWLQLVSVLWQCHCGSAHGPALRALSRTAAFPARQRSDAPLGNLAARCFSSPDCFLLSFPSFPSFLRSSFPSFVLPLFLAQSLGCHGTILQLASTQVAGTVGVINLKETWNASTLRTFYFRLTGNAYSFHVRYSRWKVRARILQ